MADEVIAKFNGVDILVNNAGIFTPGSPLEGDPQGWENMFSVNVHAPMQLMRLLCPLMETRGGGAVINVGSIAGVESMQGMAASYAASKHALRGWHISSYTSLRHKNIKCCLINPGFVNTSLIDPLITSNMNRDRMIQPKDLAEYVEWILKSSPGCVPEEITIRLAIPP
eukprot:GHVR01028599.1.p2 GENE.GHVR01028599.1~~GHVR01028599.1.p2  ORF type:complete len:169 (-),score=32.87 GHVR01028599.1:75-581(-)